VACLLQEMAELGRPSQSPPTCHMSVSAALNSSSSGPADGLSVDSAD